jgi:hypothetical protein
MRFRERLVEYGKGFKNQEFHALAIKEVTSRTKRVDLRS